MQPEWVLFFIVVGIGTAMSAVGLPQGSEYNDASLSREHCYHLWSVRKQATHDDPWVGRAWQPPWLYARLSRALSATWTLQLGHASMFKLAYYCLWIFMHYIINAWFITSHIVCSRNFCSRMWYLGLTTLSFAVFRNLK